VRHFAAVAVTIAFIAGSLLDFAWLRLVDSANARNIQWLTRINAACGHTIEMVLLSIPVIIALLIVGRFQTKLIGPETLAAEKAQEKRRLAELATALGWTIPRSAEAADWPKILLLTLSVDFIIFLTIYSIASIPDSPATLSPSETLPPFASHPLRCALLISNAITLAVLLFWVLFALIVPNRILLLHDGIGQLHTRRIIPYSLIEKVRIAPSPRHPRLKCLAILAQNEFGQCWRHYEFGPDAPMPQLLATFKANGINVESD